MIRALKTHCIHGHALALDNIQFRTWRGKTTRRCRTCHNGRKRVRVIHVEKRILIESPKEKVLREKVEELQEEIRQLRELFAPDYMFSSLKLTRRERKMLSLLYNNAGRITSHNKIQTLFLGEDQSEGLITAYIYKLRCKGVIIKTCKGEGYLISREDADKLKAFE